MEEKEGVDRLIRFRELKVSIVTESVSVGGRGESNNLSLPSFSLLSLFLSVVIFFSLCFSPHPEAKEPNSIIYSELVPEI